MSTSTLNICEKNKFLWSKKKVYVYTYTYIYKCFIFTNPIVVIKMILFVLQQAFVFHAMLSVQFFPTLVDKYQGALQPSSIS